MSLGSLAHWSLFWIMQKGLLTPPPRPLSFQKEASLLSFEEPRGSGAVLSHHTVHAPRASIARVTVRDEGPESAHLGLRG